MPQVWCPEPKFVDEQALPTYIEGMKYAGCRPCDPSLITMLAALSTSLLDDATARQLPQFVALAYWLRPAHLTRLSLELSQRDSPGLLRSPRGIALHLPPANVDTIFVYSWAMSVLAGNANVVRLSERLTLNADWLVRATARVVAQHDETHRQIFCNYPYGGETERAIAAQCDLRLIWGGDAKVRAVAQVPIRPDGLSLGFPDRQSLAIFDSDAYQIADEATRDKLAANFFNDVYWFDQMGCGSPRLLVWLGNPGELASDFYRRLRRAIQAHRYSVETGVTIDNSALANDLLAEGIATHYERFDNALHVSRTVDPVAAIARPHGGGFLCDWVAESLDAVAGMIGRKVQTITHFGIAPAAVERLGLSIAGRGGYRIVPVGQALQFDTTWDGVELFEHMTRKVLIRW